MPQQLKPKFLEFLHSGKLPVAFTVIKVSGIVCVILSTVSFCNPRPLLERYKVSLFPTKLELLNLFFSNSLIIHEEKTKEITTVKEVWICDPNYHKIRRSFALIFSKNYQCLEKLYQTLERVFHQISKHFEVG